tara:strand:- start:888 stop:1529 length:642 start_codon:yes stop_codon:yes gene_type:complete
VKPFGYVILIAVFSLGPLLFLAGYLSDQSSKKIDEELKGLGAVILEEPVLLDLQGFIDHEERPFGRDQFVGNWSFIYFGFTRCPDFCPLTLSILAKAESALLADEGAMEGMRFQGLLFTIDPARDKPENLGPYVKTFSERFSGVWSADGVDELARKVDVRFEQAKMDNGGYMFDHTSNVVIVGPRSRYIGYIKRPHSAEQIAQIFELLGKKNS